MSAEHFFKKQQLIEILESVKNKTLGEVDTKSVFNRAINKPKITGIAGDVIEQSVLGYPPNQDQSPDLNVEGVLTELKTTGMRAKKINGCLKYVAKEPASITAVSINSIALEDFNNSKLWHKIEHLLFVFYLYDSEKTVPAYEYRKFYIKGYKFYEFSQSDIEVIRNDWQIIHDFIADIQKRCTREQAEKEYPNLSTKINKQTVYLDTAPKYPKSPRFRIRRRVLDIIIQQSFSNESLEQLPNPYRGLSDVEKKCRELSDKYNNWTIDRLFKYFNIANVDNKNTVPKQCSEQIIVKMFGGNSKKISKIEMFKKFGYIGKSVTISRLEKRTEDIKLFAVDFDDLREEMIEDENGTIREKTFEDSDLYQYLTENRFLCIVFQEEPDVNGKVNLKDNRFKKFEIIELSDDDLLKDAKTAWEKARDLIVNNKLKDLPVLDKNGNQRFTTKTNIPMTVPNFPKSKDGLLFFRGGGKDATDKVEVNGISMLRQYYWIRGSYIVDKIMNRR